MNSGEQTPNEEVIIIKDSKKIFSGIVAIILLGVFIAASEDFSLSLSLFALIVMVIFILKAEWGGIKLDFNNDSIYFPGRGISFNSFSKTMLNFNKMFRRYSYKISEIWSISGGVDITKDGKVGRHTLTLTTSEGAAVLKFSNASQRDQVYAIIANVNDMGAPIKNR